MHTIPPPKLGDIIDRYRVVRSLGSGAAGPLFEVLDVQANRPFALRWLSPLLAASSAALGRFRTDVVVATQLHHPNIARTHGIGAHEGHPYLITELLGSGVRLDQRMAEQPKLGTQAACRLLMPVLRAVSGAHALGLQHRDLRPETIYLKADVGLEIPKVMDYALGKLAVEAETLNRVSAGNTLMRGFRYAAPELLHAKPNLDVTVDVYAIGVLLYRLLTGVFPYRANNPVDLVLAMRLPAPAIHEHDASLPPGLASVVARALAPEPGERHQSADAFGLALESFAGGMGYFEIGSVQTRVPSGSPPAPARLDLAKRGEWKALNLDAPLSASSQAPRRRTPGRRLAFTLPQGKPSKLPKKLLLAAGVASLTLLALLTWLLRGAPAQTDAARVPPPLPAHEPREPPAARAGEHEKDTHAGAATDDWEAPR